MPNSAYQKTTNDIVNFHSYSVIVNYDLTVEQLIKAGGKFNWVNDNITSSHFPSSEKGIAEVLIYLANFTRLIRSGDVIKELDRQGLRPATLKELLALGVARPDLQRIDPIVALGSKWRDSGGRVGVPCLDGDGGCRRLVLALWRGDWDLHWRFVAVRK